MKDRVIKNETTQLLGNALQKLLGHFKFYPEDNKMYQILKFP